MPFRFRGSWKLAPGLRINVSKSGISTTVGTHAAHISVGRRGVTSTISAPGTGLSYSHTIHRKTAAAAAGAARPSGAQWLRWLLLIGLAVWFIWLVTHNGELPQ